MVHSKHEKNRGGLWKQTHTNSLQEVLENLSIKVIMKWPRGVWTDGAWPGGFQSAAMGRQWHLVAVHCCYIRIDESLQSLLSLHCSASVLETKDFSNIWREFVRIWLKPEFSGLRSSRKIHYYKPFIKKPRANYDSMMELCTSQRSKVDLAATSGTEDFDQSWWYSCSNCIHIRRTSEGHRLHC